MSNRSISAHIKVAPLIPSLVQLIVIDAFCGAGGFTEGVERAVDEAGNRLAVVVAGVNHDALAIASHQANHPETTHFVEDVRDKTLPRRIMKVVKQARKTYPNAKVLFHASLECTNFSNAKGGKARDADSRSLAEFMPTYLTVLKPDYFTVENVREFMSWGPLNEQGRPVNRKKGEDYVRWYQGIEALGYRYDYRLHNTADYGANTSRTRYFAQFVRDGLPLVWPKPTHARNPEKASMFDTPLQKWRPIRECLQLEDKGRSIFRETPLSEKTYERIFEGLIRHVGNGDRSFISKYFTGTGMHSSLEQPAATVKTRDNQALVTTEPFMARLFATASNNHGTYPTDQPATTITTADGHAMVTPEPFAMTYYTGSPENRVKSMDDPAQTITTCNRIALVSSEPFVMQSNGGEAASKVYPSDQPSRVVTTSDNQSAVFCMKYHSTGENTFDTDQPCSTLPTKDRIGVVNSQFISLYHSQGKQNDSVEAPAGCITTIPKHRLVSALFIDQQYGKSKPVSVEQPSPCITVNPHCALVNAEFITQRNGDEQRNYPLDEPAKTVTTTGGNMELVSADWLMTNMHRNQGTSLEQPAPTLLTGTHHYVMSTNFGNVGVALESPSPTITADRHWAYLVSTTGNVQPVVLVYESDTFWQRRIKAFMAEHGIADILMRMLKVVELKMIQGFPSDYVLLGSQTHQKKFIGNSVPPRYPKAWMTEIGLSLRGL